MKSRVNLTVETSLLVQAKKYAAENNLSLSEIFEKQIAQVVQPIRKSSLIDLIESLPKPQIDEDIDLKKQYFEERASKYGF